MKLSFVLVFVTLSVSFVQSSQEMSKLRQKRSMLYMDCPADASTSACERIAKEESNALGICHKVHHERGRIVFETCGVTYCGPGQLAGIDEPWKPYPDCCSQCY